MIPNIHNTHSLANVHCHLREGDVQGPLIAAAIEGGADVLAPMPNTNAGLKTAKEVSSYCLKLRRFVPKDKKIAIIPIVMITEETTKEMIYACVDSGIMDAKIYPRFRTTKSENGVVRYGRILPIIKYAGNLGMKIHFHPEHPDAIFSNRDAEFAFLPIAKIFLEESDAIIVWENGTDARCVPHWKEMANSGKFFVTLTAHHLATNEDVTFGDVRAVCKPPIKTEADRQALIELVGENHLWVMAGPDDAPHDKGSKHVHMMRCACGAYTAPFLLPLYAHALDYLFARPEGFDTFLNFTSRNARRLHGLNIAPKLITLINEPQEIPLSYKIGSWEVEPFGAGERINWRISNNR